MNGQIQTLTALLVVAAAVIGLVWRAHVRRKNPGCGGDCGCPTDELKAKLRR